MLAAADSLPVLGPDAPPILLVHGDADTMIPVDAMFAAAGALGRAGALVQWHLSRGMGHSIDADGLLLGGAFPGDGVARILEAPVRAGFVPAQLRLSQFGHIESGRLRHRHAGWHCARMPLMFAHL